MENKCQNSIKNRHHVFLTSEEGEEQKCIGCQFFTSKKYSGPIGYIRLYTNRQLVYITLISSRSGTGLCNLNYDTAP